MEKVYTVEERDGKLYIKTPYSDHMTQFFRFIEAKWKDPYRIANKKHYDIIMNELLYYYGEPGDASVDLAIEVSKLKVSDRLVIAGSVCVEVDVLNKGFQLSENTYILDKKDYNNWIKMTSLSSNPNYFFTKKIYGVFSPFMIENSTILVVNISKKRAQAFIDSNPKWAKKISIIPSQNDKFFELAKCGFKCSL